MASCDHLCNVEEQLRELLVVVNDHLTLHEPAEGGFGSVWAIAFHGNEAVHALGYLLDQADEADSVNPPKEVGH